MYHRLITVNGGIAQLPLDEGAYIELKHQRPSYDTLLSQLEFKESGKLVDTSEQHDSLARMQLEQDGLRQVCDFADIMDSRANAGRKTTTVTIDLLPPYASECSDAGPNATQFEAEAQYRINSTWYGRCRALLSDFRLKQDHPCESQLCAADDMAFADVDSRRSKTQRLGSHDTHSAEIFEPNTSQSAAPSHPAAEETRHYVSIESTMGGVGNQRECIVNLLILAKVLNFCAVLPSVSLIAHKFQEQGQKGRNNYVPPWHDRETWGRFELLFDQELFLQSAQKLGICLVPQAPAGLRKYNLNVFAARSVPRPEIPHHFQSAFDAYITQQEIKNSVHFELDTCFRFLLSRGEYEDCQSAVGTEMCKAITSSLVLNEAIQDAVDSVVAALKSIERNRAQDREATQVTWHALHINEWHCSVNKQRIEMYLLNTSQYISKQGPRWLYLISEARGSKEELFGTEVFERIFTKEDIIPDARRHFPYEVMAQIDFEVGTAISDIYLAQQGSSSDAYIVARRRHEGRQTVELDGWYDICQATKS